MNDWILMSLHKAAATDKASRVTAEKVVGVLRSMPETKSLLVARSEGILSRTVSMVASSVLGDKLSWVGYEKANPRKFWLTEEGEARAKLLLGEEAK